MLISFAVENYLSIKDRVELSMQAMPDRANDDKELAKNYQTFSLSEKEDKKYNILKSVLIYGLNASGKTNILYAIQQFANFVVTSFERGNQQISVVPFKLSSGTCEAPTTFEVVILLNGTYYRYGFSATKNYIFKEWLFSSTKGRESRIIYRERQENSDNYSFYNSKFRSLHKQVRENSLLLTVANLNNVPMAKEIIAFFEKVNLRPNGSRILPREENRGLLGKIMQHLDIGVQDIQYTKKEVTNKDIEKLFSENPMLRNIHDSDSSEIKDRIRKDLSEIEDVSFSYIDDNGKEVYLSERLQSTGTLNIFSLISDLINSYKENSIIIIDEIEESLHPLLLQYFFKLFHAIPNNKVQLICTTYNVSLMSRGFRRDQIHITEKDDSLATTLVSIDDFTGISKKTPKQILEMYLDGRFGGVPALSDLDIMNFVQALHEKEG